MLVTETWGPQQQGDAIGKLVVFVDQRNQQFHTGGKIVMQKL